MEMSNKNFALFQKENYQINNQIINPKIDSSIKRLKKDFFDGKFKEAVTFLDSLLEENEHNVAVKYQLLLVKIDFLINFRKFDEFNEYIELVEKQYSEFITLTFKEYKLLSLSLSNDNSFFLLSKQLRLETPNSKPQGHFDIFFYFNNGNFEKSKEIFELEIRNEKYKEKLMLIGGQIYAKLYNYGEDDLNYFDKADEYYQKALGTDKLSFFEKMNIQGFYATHSLNDIMKGKKTDYNRLIFSLKEYKTSVELILNHKNYFNSEYVNNLLGNYMLLLLNLNLRDDFIEVYESNEEHLSIKYYMFFCDAKNINYNHEKIKNYLISNFELEDLLFYISKVQNANMDDTKFIVDFLKGNSHYLFKYNIVMYFFIKGSILLDIKIDQDLEEYLSKNKSNDLDSLLSFLEYQFYVGNGIEDLDTEKLIELSCKDNITLSKIINIIGFLKRIGNSKEYLALALKKQDIFKDIIFEALKICEIDKGLNFNDFDEFINQINSKNDYGAIIGNIYVKYNKLNSAFNFYYAEYKKDKRFDIMFALLNVGLSIFHDLGNKFKIKQQQEIFNHLILDISKLGIKDLIFLLGYSVEIFDETKQVLPILNQRLLSSDIKKLDETLKIELSKIYFYLIMHYNINNGKDKKLDYKENICLQKENLIFVNESYSVSDENKKNYSIKILDNTRYCLNKYDKKFTEKSLFHTIVGNFIGYGNNPAIKKLYIDNTKEEPFSEMFEMLKQQSKNTKEFFQSYSNGDKISFYSLSDKRYEKYFALIPKLLEDETLNFNSNRINILPKSVNKILTFSSIIFLYHIKKLDEVLERKDVLIQRTLINWLQIYIEKLNSTEEIFSIYSDGENYFKNLSDKEEIESVKQNIFILTKKIINRGSIIEDQNEVLPIKGAYEMLADEIGQQEYQALAYCYNHNYQIITEDGIFKSLFSALKFNENFISNSLNLLPNILNYKELRSLKIELYNKKYKFVFNANDIKKLINFMCRNDINNLEKDDSKIIKILDDYGWLNKMKLEYNNKFKVLYPKVKLPVKTYFDKNVEKILLLVNDDY
ncbi:MAG: hypothetical protein WBG30_07525 [Psychrilyobacter sp.]|uniref:hypothetical protein n=1 Tax=Psychrilyobacter sp. TaxID=2586924 RepID=UPI003C76E09A